jgi:pimeloyl-ACP methyl ester carboxylesterase
LPQIRRDLAKYVTSVPSREELLATPRRNAAFDRPVLVMWAKQDRMMPPEHGGKLAALYRTRDSSRSTTATP